MSETLLSILTSEVWSWDSREAIYIIFDKEGTGKVINFPFIFKAIEGHCN